MRVIGEKDAKIKSGRVKQKTDEFFENGFKYQGDSLVYHQFRRNCISSKRSFVYHQVAEEYTFGDDIHAEA